MTTTYFVNSKNAYVYKYCLDSHLHLYMNIKLLSNSLIIINTFEKTIPISKF